MPIIVNTVLNEHQLVLDIVAFVALGDFPKSRLGEKQRGKILASWVSRKMRTVAQFSIRDPDAEGSVGTVVPEEAFVRRGSTQSGAAGAASLLRGESSLRHVQSVNQIATKEPVAETELLSVQTQPRSMSMTDTMHTDTRNDDTPTNERHPQLNLNTTLDYSPVDQFGDAERSSSYPQGEWETSATYQPGHGYPEWPSGAPELDYSPEESPVEVPRPLGTLRIANRTSEVSEDWGESALKDLNLNNR